MLLLPLSLWVLMLTSTGDGRQEVIMAGEWIVEVVVVLMWCCVCGVLESKKAVVSDDTE